MSHIFISYSHADHEYVNKLHAALLSEGFDAWIDGRIDYGDQWPKVIQKHLDECNAFLIVMSGNSFESDMVQNEITRAREKKKTIFPLLLEGESWLIVQARQYVDVRDGSLPTEKFYKRLEAVTSRKKIADGKSELKKRESEATLYESNGEFLNALKVWYEVKRIDPSYPRVDIKIREVEQMIARENSERARTERAAARKLALEKTFSKLLSTAASIRPKSTRASVFSGLVIGLLSLSLLAFWNFFYLPKEIIERDVTMVLIPAGKFTMGSDRGFSNEGPPHLVNLDAFYIDKYEVTNGLYRACVEDGPCETPSDTLPGDTLTRENHPIVYVDWHMANAYCRWRDARLPTEAEWEKAARGTDGFDYPWDMEMKTGYANVSGDDTKPVDSDPNDESPYKVYNMAGNVSEWVSDWFSLDYYQFVLDKNVANPQGPQIPPFSSSHNFYGRVFRGGNWSSKSDTEIRTTYRSHASLDSKFSYLGFRCAKDVP